MGFLKGIFSNSTEKSNVVQDIVGKQLAEGTSEIEKVVASDLQQFSFPEQIQGISDLITSAPRGKKFKYVAISDQPEESDESIVSRLHMIFPASKRTSLNFSKIRPMHLRDMQSTYQISEDVERTYKGKIQDFVKIHGIYTLFVGTTSITDEFSSALVALHDGRKLRGQIGRSIKCNSNATVVGRVSYDFCFHKDALRHMQISVTCLHQVLKPGEVWGALKIMLLIETADFPFQTSIEKTLAVAQLPGSTLLDYETDPKHIDISLSQTDVDELKVMHRRGDLMDRSNLKDDTDKRVYYASTRGGAGNEGSDNESIIDDITPDFINGDPGVDKAKISIVKPDSQHRRQESIERWRRQYEQPVATTSSGISLQNVEGNMIITRNNPITVKKPSLKESAIDIIPFPQHPGSREVASKRVVTIHDPRNRDPDSDDELGPEDSSSQIQGSINNPFASHM